MASLLLANVAYSCTEALDPNKKSTKNKEEKGSLPIVISTWSHIDDNLIAYNQMLSTNNLDGIEAGINSVENDPLDQSVGLGGRPDRSGSVTLDACIMDSNHKAGSVSYLKEIKNPISVARKVMDSTPHVMLVGQGAQDFAVANGFKKENLLTENSKKDYKEWLKESVYKPKVNIELHDTVGMIAVDANGDIAGGCSTSGLGYKMPGRVGDSPIIGAGLYVDNEVGAATATGMGELVLTTLGSFLIVELMRQGMNPLEACKEAVQRTADKNKDTYKSLQVGYIAVDKHGRHGAYSIQPGFSYTVTYDGYNEVVEVQSIIPPKVN